MWMRQMVVVFSGNGVGVTKETPSKIVQYKDVLCHVCLTIGVMFACQSLKVVGLVG